MNLHRRPRRYSELVHHASNGTRAALEIGCWVVVGDPWHEIALAIAMVVAGPEHISNAGYPPEQVWTLHDGVKRQVSDLSRLDLAGVLQEATEVLAGIRRGRDPEESDHAILRTHRAACLARRCSVTGDALAPLVALIALDEALAEYEAAWREMVRVRLPNLVRCLRDAAVCELARHPFWSPGEGRPHPRWAVDEN